MKALKTTLASVLVLICSFALTAKPQKDTVRILAIGNSFSQDAVEQYLFELAEAEDIHVIIGNMYIGGCTLERHVKNIREDKSAYAYRKIISDGIKKELRDMSLSKALADEAWDYVSLQQASSLSGLYETYAKSLPELYSYVKERVPKDTKFIIHRTWAYAVDSGHSGFKTYDRDQMKMFNAIVDATSRAAKLTGIKIIVPSGTAIQNARTSFIGDRLCRDGYHLDLLWGRYTAACTWFETLFGNVVGNSYAPDGLTADYKEAAQLAAHYAVRNPDKVTKVNVRELPVLYKDASVPIEDRVEDLLLRMSLSEKVLQLNQYVIGRNDNINNFGEVVKKIPADCGSLIYFGDDAVMRNAMQKMAVEKTRLGIPILFGFDVIHGFRTIYPIPLAQAASWNTSLSGEACRIAAAEAYSTGVNWTFSPMVDIARDGRWGRIAEGYGEDPYLCSAFSAATVRAYQGDDLSKKNNIAACLKHFIGYGASEAGRDYVPTEISRQTLWDTYLPSFKAGVDAGAVTLMSSFNNISGTPGSANHYTMTEILKERWQHDGFVIADWNAILQLIPQGMAADKKEAARLAFNAGLDMDMVDDIYRQHLATLVKTGKVSHERLDDAVRRVLRLKFRLGLFENPYTEEKPESERFLLTESLAVAESLAVETMVLLENKGNILPLSASSKIALIGPLAKDKDNLLGSWFGRGRGEDVISIHEGVSEAWSSDVLYARGCDFDGRDSSGFAEAVSVASKADVVVLCLGEKRSWSGENASRSTIALPTIQEELLTAVKRAGKPVVVLLANGRPLDLTRISPLSDAVLEIWQPGVMAGPAVAGILNGKYNPSGKLPVTFPYTTGQIPIYYNHRKSGRTQGMYQDIPSSPMYEFGYGLSYTSFEYSDLKICTVSGKETSVFSAEEELVATVTVTNKGKVAGKETVQWYVSDPFSTITRPVKELRYFEKQHFLPEESRTFTFIINPLRDLGFVDQDGRQFIEKGQFDIMAGDEKVSIEIR